MPSAASHAKYRDSVHGQALTSGNPDVPTCITCHPAHTAEDPRTIDFRIKSPELCASCHADKELMAKYGISTEVFETYVADFHGKTVMLFEQTAPGQTTNKAVCIDCHGVHDIASARDENSAMQTNLVRRLPGVPSGCYGQLRQHPGSGTTPRIGGTLRSWRRSPGFTVMIPALLAFFIIYILIDVQHRYRMNRKRKKEAEAS